MSCVERSTAPHQRNKKGFRGGAKGKLPVRPVRECLWLWSWMQGGGEKRQNGNFERMRHTGGVSLFSPSERRRHPRVPVRTPATLLPAPDGPVELWQVSQEGMFLRMERSPRILDGLRVIAHLREGTVEAVVQVRSFLPKGSFKSHPEVSGCGCQVVQMPIESRRIIQAYVGRMREVYSQLQFQMAIGRTPDSALIKEACLEWMTDRAMLKEQVGRMVRSFSQRKL